MPIYYIRYCDTYVAFLNFLQVPFTVARGKISNEARIFFCAHEEDLITIEQNAMVEIFDEERDWEFSPHVILYN